MRTPTPLRDVYAWWRAALAGCKPPIHDSEPRAGFYQRRLVKGGPMVGVKIWLDQPIDDDSGELTGDERFLCEVNGKTADAAEQWSFCANSPITASDHEHLLAKSAWARQHRPDHPAANPKQAVDWATAPITF